MTLARTDRSASRLVAIVLLVVTEAVLVLLGIWQLERRAWKLALIADVDRRIYATAQAAPGPEKWPARGSLAPYSHVWIHGVYRAIQPTLVQAVTEKGPGFWVLAPMTADSGFVVLVNRGFVPLDAREQVRKPATGQVKVTGLLRESEPGGAFLHHNAPAANRWYSRDVGAIATTYGLSRVAPYFIDADATAGYTGWPAGGMTVVHFRNAHLSYALTWFSLAAMLAGWGLWAARRPRSTRSEP